MGEAEALRADWRAQAAAVGVDGITVDTTAPELPGMAALDREAVVAEALVRVSTESSTWLHADVSRHVATLLPAGAASATDLAALVDELTALAADRCVELQPDVPANLARRRDGRPVTEAVTERWLTTAAVLDQESRLLSWAHGAPDRRRLSPPTPTPPSSRRLAGTSAWCW